MPNPATDTSPGVPSPPAPPISTLVSQYGRGLQVTIVSVKPADFLRYRYYKGTSPGALSFWRESDGMAEFDYDTAYGTTYYYASTQMNTSMLESTQTAAASGTPAQWEAPDIQSKQVTKGFRDYVAGDIANSGLAGGVYVVCNQVTGVGVEVANEDVLVMWSGEIQIDNDYSAVQALGVGLQLYRDGSPIYQGSLTLILDTGGQMIIPVTINTIDLNLAVGTYAYTVATAISGSVSGADAKLLTRKRNLSVLSLRV